ncbi:putative f-box domain-containing protein [Phaeomoniella chlamydospora]|uniref:Probable E3 ubiquitin ligase complex SCF subunit sconB n=1 Tax=Phaeomoniella chlamydospora TaxID=158046 RepID=A0A0G2F3J8_PHACM|nr:putative f-box domain-containing protein [Phaeomoniella chlamydospora]
MPKRRRDEEDSEVFTPVKRSRSYYSIDRLSVLSDELVLRILSYLPVHSLLRCQSISRRFHTLAGDSEVWKEKYYARFVRPRARRIPGIKVSALSHTHYSSKLSKWLDDDHLVRKGRETNWKSQYRLRHNWSKGSCRMKELDVAQPPIPSALVKYHQGMVVTLNIEHDLRVWRLKDGTFLGEVRAVGEHSTPTSLSIDAGISTAEHITLTVGYENGSFRIFDMQVSSAKFTKRYAHPASSNGAISSIASTFPYLLTLSQDKTLSLYRFEDGPELAGNRLQPSTLSDPALLSSLIASQAYHPVTVSIRTTSLGVIACIAYSYSRLRLGWNIGLQELLLDRFGKEISSRIAWTPDWLERSANVLYDSVDHEPEIIDFGVELSRQAFIRTKPTSLSYSHPYLLASYPDNTLKVYQVSSTADFLTIASGRRLWGHTSGVSGAEVSDRGKAVSVSSKGNDIRIWELEEGLGKSSSSSSISNLASTGSGGILQRSSIRVQAIPSSDNNKIKHHYQHRHLFDDPNAPTNTDQPLKYWGDIPLTKSNLDPSIHEVTSTPMEPEAAGYIAFDDEQVIVLNHRAGGEQQYITCYDFT